MKGLMLRGTWDPRTGYTPVSREKDDQRALSTKNVYRNSTLSLEEIPEPTLGENEVKIKVGACGICDSDIDFLNIDSNGYTSYVGHTKLPVVIGHEFAGEVVEVGAKVGKFKPGDLVTAETMNWCGECMPCRCGMFNQCDNLEELGFTLGGGMGEYMKAQEKYCLNINDFIGVYGDKNKAMEVGALVEPFAVAYNCMFSFAHGLKPGAYVAVFGAGPTGLASIMIASASGAAKVMVFDVSGKALDLAKKVGATDVFNLNELREKGISPSRAILDSTKGVGMHMGVECSSHCNENLPEMEKAMSVGGQIVQISHSGKATDFFGQHYQKKGASFHSSNGSSGHGNWEAVVRMISSGVIDPSKIIAGKFPLDQALDGLRKAGERSGGKYLITPNA